MKIFFATQMITQLGPLMNKIVGLLSLAAMLISSAQVCAQQVGTIGIGDITVSAEASVERHTVEGIITAVSSGINTGLNNTRKFSVLDYRQLQTRITQQDRSLADYYNKKYTGNALSQAGLDYILRTDVTEFSLLAEAPDGSEKSTALMNIEFELIGVADVTDSLNSKVVTQISKSISARDDDSGEKLLDSVIQRAVKQLVDQVVSNLFPVRVMKITEEGVITMNYGEGMFTVGDTVMIYPIGTDATVDQSGEPMGASIATLQITSTEQKFAIAKVLDGQQALEKGQKGQLVLTATGG
jgi:hypothetical protein